MSQGVEHSVCSTVHGALSTIDSAQYKMHVSLFPVHGSVSQWGDTSNYQVEYSRPPPQCSQCTVLSCTLVYCYTALHFSMMHCITIHFSTFQRTGLYI